jgi:hypothetical protein
VFSGAGKLAVFLINDVGFRSSALTRLGATLRVGLAFIKLAGRYRLAVGCNRTKRYLPVEPFLITNLAGMSTSSWPY